MPERNTNVNLDKKLLLKRIEEEKKEAEEQLEICGENFLFAISQMI